MLTSSFSRFLITVFGIGTLAALLFFAVRTANEPEVVPEPPVATTRTVSLYYYDPAADIDATGNILCSRQGLVAVEREVPLDATIQDVLELHLRGDLRSTESADGIITEYPLSGFSLVSSELIDGELALTFDDPENRTVGGSCRVGILWMQIEATALQFPEVTSVTFAPEELFQP
jgi:hypothetical protein